MFIGLCPTLTRMVLNHMAAARDLGRGDLESLYITLAWGGGGGEGERGPGSESSGPL
jgi:hypothetical protein